MALESKPLFHPEVIRQQVRSFTLPESFGDWQPKLQHWADSIASGGADDFKETALLPDLLTNTLSASVGRGIKGEVSLASLPLILGLLGYTGPAEPVDTAEVQGPEF